MTDVTRILASLGNDTNSTDTLLPLVYDELRRMAQLRIRNEEPGQTLDATALVHEAYLRLVKSDNRQAWENRRHFFAAAAESMRRILIDSARRKSRQRHGGGLTRRELDDTCSSLVRDPAQVLAVNDALERLVKADEVAAEIAKLRYFAGFSVDDAAEALNMSRATAYRHWQYARAWLQCELHDDVSENWENS